MILQTLGISHIWYIPKLNIASRRRSFNFGQILNKYRIMYGLLGITIFSKVRWFSNDFHKWLPHSWRSLLNCLDFLHAILGPDRAHKPAKAITDFSFRHFHQEQSFLTWHSDVITIQSVTSHKHEVLVFWRSYSLIVLENVQIGAKAIFTSE